MTFSYTHLGCKVNECEIHAAASDFFSAGFENLPFLKGNADVVIINTCCVTLESEAKSRKVISRARRLSPNGVIAVTGCFSQMFSDAAIKSGADIIIPNDKKDKIFLLVCSELVKRNKLDAIPDLTENVMYFDRTRASLKVQDGCDNFCSYCIIPYARGPLKSVKADAVIKEAARIAKAGYKEIVLTGIHLTRYGVDAPENGDLLSLCERVAEIDGIERIRLGSIEPGYLTEERAKRLAGIGKICPQFHLALQSGSDGVLQRMNRHYTTGQYISEVNTLKKYFDNCAVTTDIMVGFPGETDEEFSESLEFVKRVGFCRVHVFPYSLRPGTKAALMAQVDAKTKKQRTDVMLALAKKEQEEFIKSMQGKAFSVLFEREKGGKYYGYTENYIQVCTVSDCDISGRIMPVKLTSEKDGVCECRIIGE